MTKRTPEQAAAAAPFTLPPGGYEMSDLERAGKAIAGAKPGDRDGVVAEQLGKIVQRQDEPETNLLPGHRLVEREQVIVEGTQVKGEKEPVGEIRVTETIQVFDPKRADEEIAATEEATVGARPDAEAAPASGSGKQD